MHIIGDTLDDILMKLYKKLHRKKSNIKPSKGDATELIGVSIEIKKPRARLSRSEGKGKVFSALGELLWYMSGSNELSFISYYISMYENFSDDKKTIYGGYGPRIFGEDCQFNRVIQLLRKKKDSRQAIIQIFDANDLKGKYKDIPCTCTLQFFLRNNKLSLVVNMRSNDVFLGLPHDVFAFTMIQEYAAAILNCDLGEYKHFVGSLHLYEKNKVDARSYIREGWQDEFEMPLMPRKNVESDLKLVLMAERKIRLDEPININELSIDTYWKDILYLLKYFNAKKHTCDELMLNSILDNISDEKYKIYIKRKEVKAITGCSGYSEVEHRTLTKTLIGAINDLHLKDAGIFFDGSPIPVFGKISTSLVATLGLNPSNNEFFDSDGSELDKSNRRFHTLKSLSIDGWDSINDSGLDLIIKSCELYFHNNPYDKWFKPLDNLLSKSGLSYYGNSSNACHLDLVPFATHKKWSALSVSEKNILLSTMSSSLGSLIKNSSIKLLVLNGRTVVEQLKLISDIEITENEIPSLALNRKSGRDVKGYEYTGRLKHISGVDIGRYIYVFGFNHNIQSSFGVTNIVKNEIKNRMYNYWAKL